MERLQYWMGYNHLQLCCEYGKVSCSGRVCGSDTQFGTDPWDDAVIGSDPRSPDVPSALAVARGRQMIKKGTFKQRIWRQIQ